MELEELKLSGAFLLHNSTYCDSRGSFSRIYCEAQMRNHSLSLLHAQVNISRNLNRGTLRGMHYQEAPFEEAKLVKCIKGVIFDVIVDIRPASPTYKAWLGVELSESKDTALYIPKGFAHGFITLSDNADILYLMSGPYDPHASRTFRYNDPEVAISWPENVACISDKDRMANDFCQVVSNG